MLYILYKNLDSITIELKTNIEYNVNVLSRSYMKA